MISMQEALDEVQRCKAGTDQSAVAERKRAWDLIVEASGRSEAILIDELATSLKVNKITVRRWFLGENTPRPVMFEDIRKHFNVSASDGFPYIEPESPIPFDSSHAAIWTVHQWIKSLEFADATFVCKGMMPLLAAEDADIRVYLELALTKNPDLKIYYVLIKGSAADDAYDRMIKKMRLSNPQVLGDIRKIVLERGKDEMGLTGSLASPFIVRYRDSDVNRIGRIIDILYEVPVDAVERSGRYGGDGRIAYIQLPEKYIDEVWEAWSKTLSAQQYVSADDIEKKGVGFDKYELQHLFRPWDPPLDAGSRGE